MGRGRSQGADPGYEPGGPRGPACSEAPSKAASHSGHWLTGRVFRALPGTEVSRRKAQDVVTNLAMVTGLQYARAPKHPVVLLPINSVAGQLYFSRAGPAGKLLSTGAGVVTVLKSPLPALSP